MEVTSSSSVLLPPKPEEPLDSECCGTGCTPCVFDIYKRKLKKWEDECLKITQGGESSSSTNGDDSISSNSIISPYEYSSYIVTDIIDDCLNCKILQFQKQLSADSKTNLACNNLPFPVKLGQHIVLKIEEKCRQYTVLDINENGGSFRILFKIYENGDLTPKVDKLGLGAAAEMRGPFGKEFLYKPGQYSNLIMFAAGTGIAPFSRIIDKVLENEEDETRLNLYYASRNEREVMLSGKLKEWARNWNFLVEYLFSNVEDEKVAKKVHFGMKINLKRIDKSVIEELGKKFNDKEKILYLICGTKSFEKDILNYLKSCDVPEEKIKTF